MWIRTFTAWIGALPNVRHLKVSTSHKAAVQNRGMEMNKSSLQSTRLSGHEEACLCSVNRVKQSSRVIFYPWTRKRGYTSCRASHLHLAAIPVRHIPPDISYPVTYFACREVCGEIVLMEVRSSSVSAEDFLLLWMEYFVVGVYTTPDCG